MIYIFYFVADDPHAFPLVSGSSMKHRLKDTKRNIYQLQCLSLVWIPTQTHCQGKNYEIMWKFDLGSISYNV